MVNSHVIMLNIFTVCVVVVAMVRFRHGGGGAVKYHTVSIREHICP